MRKADQLIIRKMRHTDYEIMAQWLSTKEVLEFYGGVDSPFDLDKVKAKYGPRIDGDVPIQPYIVELDDIPVGFMQQYCLSEGKQKEYGYPADLKIYGIDQFIGVPELFNKGTGTIMVKKFMQFLYKSTDIDMIILDPEVSNTRAIRCYEKCGFQKVKMINNGSNWLMEHYKDEGWQNGN